MRPFALAALAGTTLATLAAPLAAQTFRTDSLGPSTAAGEPRLQGGLALSIGQPVHEFRQYVANGVGGSGHALYRLGRSGAFALRVDGGLVNYGRETQRIPWNDRVGRITVDLQTNNNIVWGGIGPQLMVPSGIVRPYATGAVGFAVFSTSSSIRDRDTNEEIVSDNNKMDGTWALSGGGGVLVPLFRNPKTLVFLDLGARFHRNGSVEYLREGGISDLPGGGVQYSTIRSAGDLWTYQIGISIGGR
jgi:opacity protein-like surface antigen